MKTRTWTYGTTRKGEVVDIIKMDTRGAQAHVVTDDTKEGHILFNGAYDETAKVGDKGTLTFTEGGPTGGYWKFKKA